jgi:hypothetical protein
MRGIERTPRLARLCRLSFLVVAAGCANESDSPTDQSDAGASTGRKCEQLDGGDTSERFANNQDGTVCDHVTGLTWEQEANETPADWESAAKYCANAPLSGSGWRMPSFDELASLVKKGTRPSIDIEAFPGTPRAAFWSSTILEPPLDNEAYAIDFTDGAEGSSLRSAASLLVRCVR